jgi:pimeloyl-ACP methyl ester carboxylesterase
VDRLVDIDEAPGPGFGGLPFLAKLTFVPVIGPALRRIAPNFAIRDGYESAFAPGYDLGDFSDQVVDDYRAMTYTSYDRSPSESSDYEDEVPLDERVRSALVPLLVIFGAEDQLWDDPQAAAQAYDDVPGAVIKTIPGAGHSPNVEKPARTAGLILQFAAEAGTGRHS